MISFRLPLFLWLRLFLGDPVHVACAQSALCFDSHELTQIRGRLRSSFVGVGQEYAVCDVQSHPMLVLGLGIQLRALLVQQLDNGIGAPDSGTMKRGKSVTIGRVDVITQS